MGISVRQYTLNGLFVAEFKTIKEAAEKTGCPAHQISRCINSDSLSSYGSYIWTACWRDGRPAGTPLFVKPMPVAKYVDGRVLNGRRVRQYTKDGRFVAEYETVSAACKQYRAGNANAMASIIGSCKRKPGKLTYKGFIWRYADDDEFAR